jgi:hypothetical protein
LSKAFDANKIKKQKQNSSHWVGVQSKQTNPDISQGN